MANTTVEWDLRPDSVTLAAVLDEWNDVAGRRYRESVTGGLLLRCYLALFVILSVVVVLAMRS